MRIGLFAGAAVAGLGIALIVASSGATNANPPVAPRGPAQRANQALVARPPVRRRPSYTPPAGCTTTYTGNGGSFVGIPGEINYAGAAGSAVVAGNANESCAYNSTIAGGTNNIITAVSGDPISNADSFIGGGDQNAIAGTAGFVGDGYNNESLGEYSFLGSGTYNAVGGSGAFLGAGGLEYYVAYGLYHATAAPGNLANGADSFVGAGDLNQIAPTGSGSFIGAGGYATAARGVSTPSNRISGSDSFIGAGDANVVAGDEAFIGGGHANSASMMYSTVPGGESNYATGIAAVVGGGADSTARGEYATIPGGYKNAADGVGSFAAGTLAKARNDGAFVWSDDSSTAEFESTANNQFTARAAGGFVLYSNAAASVGVKLSPNSGTWASLSDRTMKTNVVALDDAAVLQKVAALPVSEWSYMAERGVRHVGPMAQDFYAAFGVGEDDRHITSIDEDGVALAAIKALHAENDRLHAETIRSHAENVSLRREFEADNGRLRSRLALLEAKLDRLASRSVR